VYYCCSYTTTGTWVF
nr:immunoglobulin light chain junction region [Macaca mulatta]